MRKPDDNKCIRLIRMLKGFLPAFCLSLLLIAGASTENAEASYSTGLDIHSPSQKEIVSYLANHPTGEIGHDYYGNKVGDYSIDYNELPSYDVKNPTAYNTGELSDTELVHALNTVNAVRYIAGIPDDVTLSSEYTRMAQNSAFINSVNGILTHDSKAVKGVSEYDNNLGIQGSHNSNILKTHWENNSLKWSVILGWMSDDTDSNLASVGHRRTILDPTLGMTGFGSVSSEDGTYTAMYINDSSSTATSGSTVVWPAQNMPVSYFDTKAPWSISLGKYTDGVAENGDKIDYRNLVVVVLRSSSSPSAAVSSDDREYWVFCYDSKGNSIADGDFCISTDKYGKGDCIIFRPDDIDEFRPDDKFYVYVTENYVEGDKTISRDICSYYVDFFDLENYYSLDRPALKSLCLNDAGKPEITWNEQSLADSYQVYRKAANGNWKLIKSGVKGNSYSDASALKGVKYYYRICSVRTIEGVDYKSQVSKYKTVEVPLGKVSISSVKASSKGKNTVTFKALSSATGYKIYRRVYGKSTWTLMKTMSGTSLKNATSGSTVTYKNTTAKSGVKYQYRIKAYKTYNSLTQYGTYSSIKTITTK